MADGSSGAIARVMDQMVQQKPEMKQVVDDPLVLGSVFFIVVARQVGLWQRDRWGEGRAHRVNSVGHSIAMPCSRHGRRS